MLTPFGILGLALLAVLVTVVLALIFTPRPRPKATKPEPEPYWPAIAKPNITFERIRAEQPVRTFGKRPVPPTRKPTITLTPRMMERVNMQRRARGMAPLNRTGFKAAVSIASTDTRPAPSTSSDWLTYLIMYECFFSDHASHTVGGTGGITIDPNIPYNGQGGEYGGAGASGDWTSAPASVTAAVADVAPTDIYAGVAASIAASAAAAGVSDSTPSYSSDPAPSYSAPDPSPSSPSDSGSPGGGGDSGGGGGGGD